MAHTRPRHFKLFVTPGSLRWARWPGTQLVPQFNTFNVPAAAYPLLFADNWSSYPAGNWELNAAPTWTGISGGGGSPNDTIDPNNGVVNVAGINGGGTINGVYRAPAAINQAKPRSADCFVTFFIAGSGFGSVNFGLGLDTTGNINNSGDAIQIQGATNGTWQARLLIGGIQKAITGNLTITLGQPYRVMIEVDKHNVANGYINGVKLLSWAFPSSDGTDVALSVLGGSQAIATAVRFGTVRHNGYAT